MLLKEHDLYITLCIQTSKPVELYGRAKYHLLKKNNEFFLRRFFRELIPDFDTKTVPNGMRTQRIQRKTRNFEGKLTEIHLKQGEKELWERTAKRVGINHFTLPAADEVK